MTYEKETLKLLRQSLDQEEDETSIISILQNHHKYLKEYLNLLSNSDIASIEKQAKASLFFTIFNMHAKAEEASLYRAFKDSDDHDMRMKGFKSSDENDIAFEIIDELKEMNCEKSWSEEVNVKMSVLTGLLKTHIKEEESSMFPMAEAHFPEWKLIDLAEDYLEYCKNNLKIEASDLPSEVSRSDVMTYFY